MLKELKGKVSDAAKAINKKIAVAVSVSIVAASCCGFAYAAPNKITISDSDSNNPVQIKTTDTLFGKILSKQGIVLNEGDRVNYALNDEVGDNAVIEIVRAISVKVVYMGETRDVTTTETSVAAILAEQEIAVNDSYEVYPATYENVSDGDTITIIAHDTHNITVQEELDFATEEVENASLAQGERVVTQQGQKGIKEYVYRISYQDGTEVSRELISETTLSDPVNEVVEYGPESVWELGAIPASAPTNYSKVMEFTATAYDASPADNGKWAGKTSTGMPLTYGVVAVDPRVIPYGTKMYIESVDGKYVYGYAIAGDCGGAIKGNKVDLFFPSRSKCYEFGRRAVRIYFLD